MSEWYTTREAIKAAGKLDGDGVNPQIDALIESWSRDVDGRTHRFFLPLTELRNFDWPQPHNPHSSILFVDQDLLSVSALTKDDDDVTAIAASDFFLEPQNEGPPFHKIEIDRSSSAFFSFKNTTQRAIRVTGDWGFSAATLAAGAIDTGLASGTTATSFSARSMAFS